MSKTISIHSYRGGTGKSNVSANLSYLLAASGRKTCVIDTDIQSPGIHVLFGMKDVPGGTLNDYLWGKASIEEVAHDVSANVGLPPESLYLIPCSMHMADITRVLKEGYDVKLLSNGFRTIRAALGLDYLVLDTHPGLNEETLLSIALSDALFVLMRPDQQDFQGTSVTVDVARRLKVRELFIIVNKVLAHHDLEQMRSTVEATYQCPVAAVLPLDENLIELGSASLYARQSPGSVWASALRGVLDRL